MSSRPLNPFTVPLEGVNLVEAAAGTGKTWTITALYLRLLLEQDLPVARILVVTYTRAATGELRQRLRDALVRALEAFCSGDAGTDPLVAPLLMIPLAASARPAHSLQHHELHSVHPALLSSHHCRAMQPPAVP